MKQKLIQTIVALITIVSNTFAQTLSIAPVEANVGEQAELVVSAIGMGSVTAFGMIRATALQFNIAMPQGVTLNESALVKEKAAYGHTLSVQKINNGDYLIVFYHMDLGILGNGALLRLPVTVGQQAGIFYGNLNTIRSATEDAMSVTSEDVTFSITVKALEQPITISTDNLTMTYGDDVPTLTYKSEGAELNGTPSLTTTATKTSPVGTYPITVTKGTVTNEQVTYVAGTLTITKAPLTVGVKNETITEGDAIPAFTLTYSGFRNSDTEATAFTTKPVAKTTATPSSAAGTYPITISGGEAQNYALTYGQGTLTIEEKEVDGVSSVKADEQPNTATYNLAGQKVNAQYKGIVIRNGKKVMK
jgi:hypothetical protein